MKQNRSAAQSESLTQFPLHSGKRQSGLSPKNVSTPVHGTDVAHSGNDGAAEIDGTDVGPNDGADVGFVDGVDDGEDERAEERRPHP